MSAKTTIVALKVQNMNGERFYMSRYMKLVFQGTMYLDREDKYV